MKQDTRRIAWIDFLKGIAILLMIVGHTLNPQSAVFKAIYSFHMPLFAMVSGYFFKKKEPSVRLKGILKRMILPYCTVWGIIILLQTVRDLIGHTFSVKTLLSSFAGFAFANSNSFSVFGYRIPHCGPVWFLIALALATVVADRFFEKKYAFWICALLFYFGCATAKIHALPFCIQPACAVIFFYYLGYAARKSDLVSKRLSVCWYPLILLCGYFAWTSFTAMHISYPIVPGGILNIIWAAGFNLILFKIAQRITLLPPWIWKVFCLIGKNSLAVLCFHTIWCYCKNWRILFPDPWMNIAVEIAVPLAATVVVSVIPVVRTLFGVEKFSIGSKNN